MNNMIISNAWQILAVSLLLGATAQAQCTDTGPVTISEACTVSVLQAELTKNGCDADTRTLEQSCKDASIEFGKISNLHYQFDKTYMDGGTIWNDGEQDESVIDESRITRALRTVGSESLINWPEYEALQDYVGEDNIPYMSNFNLDETCDLNTVMCCFTDDKDDREEIPDNSEVCAHDLRDSRRSNHINRGWAEFDDNANTYCTGFTFSSDKGDATNRFKGNSLLDLSFRNTVENGYVKNIPGAPMCACIEQMPTVSRADCRLTSVSDESLTYTIVNGELKVTNITAKVEFSACEVDDLKVHAEQYDIDLSDHLVGDEGCEISKHEMRNEKFWVPATIDNVYEKIPEDQWQLVAGKGSRYWPLRPGAEALVEYDKEFRAMLGEAPFVVRRYCDSCAPSHRDIYYKRLTPLPEGLNFLDLFLNNWKSGEGNEFHKDFELYSSMDDVKAESNEWTFCNFNYGGIGFPRDCGPTGRIDCQWNSYSRGICGGTHNAFDHAFYVPVVQTNR
mmetsp:Transcript_7833/g.11962  ORF Transcript_7833/g.11962 Transcript_7833/m.11962 type:complete len:507 (-) Transcript_7833:105-1625(-)